MTEPTGYYDESYPPELWETPPPAPMGAARAVPVSDVPATVTVAGAPDTAPVLEAAPPAVGDVVAGAAETLTDDAAAALAAAGPLPELPADAYPADAVPLPGIPVAVEFTVAAGAPGSYDPPVKGAQRPRNITDLDERARPVAPFAWHSGQYVPVGEKGKTAYWDGTSWRIGKAPQVADQQVPAAGTTSTVPTGTVDPG